MNTKFSAIVICCTGLNAVDRDKCFQIVTNGSGSYRRDLCENVTHLIATSNTLSEKYKAAVARCIPVVHPSWLYECDSSRVSDPLIEVENFIIKPFFSLVICITGYSVEEREWVESMVNANGGSFSPDLSKSCTHLVAETGRNAGLGRESPKITYAKKWHIAIVTIKWIRDCVKQKGRISEDLYDAEYNQVQSKIFEGKRFFIGGRCGSGDDDLKSKEKMKQVLIENGAAFIEVEQNDSMCNSSNVSLNCDNAKCIFDYVIWMGKYYNNALKDVPPQIPVVSEDWINECILQEMITPYEPYSFTLKSPSMTERFVTPNKLPLKANPELSCNTLNENSFLNGEVHISLPSLGKKLFEETNFFIFVESFKSELYYKEICQLIVSNGACLSQSPAQAKYLLCSFEWNNIYSAVADWSTDKHKLVTDIWLLGCVQENSLLSTHLHILFTPSKFSLQLVAKNPNTLISISGFEGLHRELTIKVIEYCGFKYADKFNRKVSFLICKKMSGLKYDKALEWNVPIKIEAWLIEQLLACSSSQNTSESNSRRGITLPPYSTNSSGIEDNFVNSTFSNEPELTFFNRSKSQIKNSANETNQQSFVFDTKSILETGFSPLIPSIFLHLFLDQKKSIHVSKSDVSNFSKRLANVAEECKAKEPPSLSCSKYDIKSSIHNNVPIQTHSDKKVTDIKLEPNCPLANNLMSQIFSGLTFSLSPRLWHRRIELSGIIEQCGGHFKCSLDSECTHFIHYGNRLVENFKEFKQATSQKCFIISPWWIIKSKEACRRLPEDDFPHIYVPGKSLSLQTITNQKPVQSSTIQSTEVIKSDSVASSYFDEIDSLIERNSKKQKFSSNEINLQASKAIENLMEVHGNPAITKAKKEIGSVKFSDIEYENAKTNLFQKLGISPNEANASETVEPCEKHSDLKQLKANHDLASHLESQENTEQSTAEDNFSHKKNTHAIVTKNYIFLLSSLTEPQRASFSKFIVKYGGTSLKTSSWDFSCTHLVCGSLARNEKILSAIASGRWILKPSFIIACREAGGFIDEMQHEWAFSESSELALASQYWRMERERSTAENVLFGPFNGWISVLYVSSARETPFKHVIEAGGGTVIDISTSATNQQRLMRNVNYIFVENESFLPKISRSLVNNVMTDSSINLLKIDYVSDFLIKKRQVNINNYIVK